MRIGEVVIVADDLESLGGVQKIANVLGAAFATRGYKVSLLGINNSPKSMLYQREPTIQIDSIFDESHAQAAERASKELTAEGKAAVWIDHRQRKVGGQEKLNRYISAWSGSTVLIVLQLHSLKLLIEAGLLSRTDRPKVLAQYHGSFDYAAKRGYLQDLIHYFNEVDCALFLTAEEAESFKSAGVGRATAIQNPPTFSLARPPGHEWSIRDNIAVSICRLHPEKHLDELILAWARLPARLSSWRLELYGDGPERNRLQELVTELSLGASIRFMGEITDPFHALAKAKAHLLTSHHEGWGLVIAEAAACGVPTIAYDSGPGVRKQIVSGENGILVHSRESHAFATALEGALGDEQLIRSLGMNARAKLESTNISAVVSQWEEHFSISHDP